MHYDGPEHGSRILVDGFFEGVESNGVPAIGFFEGEVAVELEVQCVVAAQLDVLVFLGDTAGDVQLGGLGVEVELCDADGKGCMDAVD